MSHPAPGNGKPLTLADGDISSQPSVTRRSLLATLGISAGVATAAAFGGSLAVAADLGGRGRKCNFRDNDWSVRPGDKVRVRCGVTDNDTRDVSNRSRSCAYRDSDTGAGRYKDTIRVKCGMSDNDR